MVKSYNVFTYELDDIKKAADELYNQVINSVALKKNTVGILLSDYDIDSFSLAKNLSERFDFEIIGSTTVGIIDKAKGYDELRICLTVLTSDTCFFHVALSEKINHKNINHEVESCYLKGEKALGERAKMIFAIPSFKEDVFIDNYIEALSLASFNIPVFGGMPIGTCGRNGMIYAKGGIYDDRLAILLIAGDIHPLFVSDYSLLNVGGQKRTITKAKNNIIYTLGDTTFIEYMKNIGISFNSSTDAEKNMKFIPTPLLIESIRDGEKHQYLRTIIEIDKESGSGISFGSIEEGAIANVGFLRKSDIVASFSSAIDTLMDKIKVNEEKYACTYSTVLCISCFSRYFVMSPNYNIEGDLIKEKLKNTKLNFTGFYLLGEISPISLNGYPINTYNDGAICLCAF